MALLTVNGIARVATDPDLKFTPSGTAVLSFRAVASKSKKNDRDEWETVNEMWFSVTAWGRLAEWGTEVLEKGQEFNLLGEIYEEEYETRDGEKRKSLKVTARGFDPIPKRNQQGGQRQPQQQGGYSQQPQGYSQPPAQGGGDPWAAPGVQGDEPPF